MDSTVAASLISGGAVLASGLLTLLITGRQESRRRSDAAVARDEERRIREDERHRAECIRIADEFYAVLDFCVGLPIDFQWDEVWSYFGEQRHERFDNEVRKAVALGGPADLREKVLHVLAAIPYSEAYAQLEGKNNYAEFTGLLRLGGDLAADAARGVEGESAKRYADFLATRASFESEEVS